MKIQRLILLSVIVSLLAAPLSIWGQSQEHVIQFFAHRGSRFEYDENTMEAFRATYDAGIRGYETDIRMTGDGDLILSHDESLKRTCGMDVGTEDLTNRQCREIRTLQGNRLVFASELAKFLKDKDNMYVEWEIKTIPELYDEARLEVLCRKLWKTVMPGKPASSEYLFTSFDKRALRIMKEMHPEAILMMLEGKSCSREIVDEALSMGINRVGCKMDGTTREAVRYAHSKGVIVSLWPGSSVDDFLLGYALGCDAMCCDRALEVGDWVLTQLSEAHIKGYEPTAEHLAAAAVKTAGKSPLSQPRTVQFLAHRGGRFETDENTLSAFQVSWAAGVRGFETDVHLSADNQLVISHDASLKRIFGADVEVENSTSAQLREIRNDKRHGVCFATELVDFLSDKEGVYIEFEIKSDAKRYTEEKLDTLCSLLYDLAEAKKPAGATFIYSSFDERALRTMRRLHPEADIMLITSKPWSAAVRKQIDDLGTRRAACHLDGTTRADVQKAHKDGIFLNLWPVSDESDFRLALAVGSDAFCLDAPFAAELYRTSTFPWLEKK